MLIAGDLYADPAVIPCLAKGMSAGRYVDLALAHSLGAGLSPDITCTFNQDGSSGSHRDFFIGCPGALAASHACYVTDRWFTPHFSLLARFRIGAWMADVACPVACQPLWPACWLDTPDRSSSSTSRIVQDVWDVYRDVLGVVPDDVVLALRNAVSWSSVNDFWSIWSRSAEAGSAAFLGRGLLRIRNRRLGGRAVGGKISSRLYRVSRGDDVDVHCAQYFVNSSLASSLSRMYSTVLGVRVLLNLGGMPFWVIGRLYVVMIRVVLSLLFVPGTSGFPRIYMVSISGFLIPLGY